VKGICTERNLATRRARSGTTFTAAGSLAFAADPVMLRDFFWAELVIDIREKRIRATTRIRVKKGIPMEFLILAERARVKRRTQPTELVPRRCSHEP
jgi:hypothetical protein